MQKKIIAILTLALGLFFSLTAYGFADDISAELTLDNEEYIVTDTPEIKVFIFTAGSAETEKEVTLSLENQKDKSVIIISKGSVKLPAGLTTKDYTVDLKSIPGGRYTVLFNVEKTTLAKANFLFLKKEEIVNDIKRLETKYAALEDLAGKAREKNIDIALPEVSLAVIDYSLQEYLDQFVSGAEERARKGRPVWAWAYWGEKERERKITLLTYNNVKYLFALAERTSEELNNLIAHPEKGVKIAPFKSAPLKVEKGVIYSEGLPTFLCGPCSSVAKEELHWLPKFGFNHIHSHCGLLPLLVLTGPEEVDEKAVAAGISYLDNAKENNVVVNYDLAPYYYPQWANKPEIWVYKVEHPRDAYPNYDIENPSVRSLYEKYLRAVWPKITNHPALFGTLFQGEAAYVCYCQKSQEMFRDYLRNQYQTIAGLNKIWKTDYKDFKEIIAPEENKNTAMWYDWCTFNQDRFIGFYKWMKDIIREYDKNVLNEVATQCCSSIWLKQYTRGIDQERMAEMGEIISTDLEQNYSHPRYAYNAVEASFGYDFLKSLDPNKPLMDHELHPLNQAGFDALIANEPEKVEVFLRTVLWHGFLHGMQICDIFSWGREGSYPQNMTNRPLPLNTYGRTSLELRKLAPYIVRFYQEKPEVYLLYSLPSMPASDHFTALRKMHEALWFLDARTGFVTEKQASEGKLKDAKLLIIASADRVKAETCQAIVNYIKEGGKAVIAGNGSLGSDEHGFGRDISFLKGDKEEDIAGVQLRVKEYGKGKVYFLDWQKSSEELSRVYDALMDKVGVDRPIRIVNSKGGDLFGVEARAVKEGKGYLVYLLNFNKEPVSVKLDAKGKIFQVKDLTILTREKLTKPEFTLAPLNPVLFQVE